MCVCCLQLNLVFNNITDWYFGFKHVYRNMLMDLHNIFNYYASVLINIDMSSN